MFLCGGGGGSWIRQRGLIGDTQEGRRCWLGAGTLEGEEGEGGRVWEGMWVVSEASVCILKCAEKIAVCEWWLAEGYWKSRREKRGV